MTQTGTPTTSGSEESAQIQITFDISTPATSTFQSTSHTLAVPFEPSSLASLREALASARDQSNAYLTEWKDKIGETEKAREKVAAQTPVAHDSDEEEGDENDGDA